MSDAEVLVVVSKLKKYIKAEAGMNTANGVAQVLSERVKSLCADAVNNAKSDGRKTVMERDFQ